MVNVCIHRSTIRQPYCNLTYSPQIPPRYLLDAPEMEATRQTPDRDRKVTVHSNFSFILYSILIFFKPYSAKVAETLANLHEMQAIYYRNNKIIVGLFLFPGNISLQIFWKEKEIL